MSKYKLVPVEPTHEMVIAGDHAEAAGCYVTGIYTDMLAAAPAVQPTPSVAGLVEALELISDTDPDEGTAWFHEVANKALIAYRKQKEE